MLSLTCRLRPKLACDIAHARSDRSLLRGRASTTCLDHFGEQGASGHLLVDLSLPGLVGRALLLVEPI